MFRFSIRDVLWLTVVVGLTVGWWITTQRLSEVQRHLSEVEAKRDAIQATLDSITQGIAKAKMDDQFRRAYDGPRQRSTR
jgi:hypothetical protein